MRIRAAEKLNKANAGKKISLGAKKAGQAEQKRIHEINMKIKKAEKNTKLFF